MVGPVGSDGFLYAPREWGTGGGMIAQGEKEGYNEKSISWKGLT